MNEKGLTPIELLVVIFFNVILPVLAMLGMPPFKFVVLLASAIILTIIVEVIGKKDKKGNKP